MITELLMYIIGGAMMIPILPFSLLGAIYGLITGEIWNIL